MSNTTNDDTTFTLYSERQILVLSILPYFTAPWSLFGSMLLIYAILVDRKKTLAKVYHRLVLGMITLDVITSLGLIIFGVWAIPVGTPYAWGARGTILTCEISGFVFNLFVGTLFYSLFFAIYFFWIVYLEWREDRFARRIEPLAHGLAIFFPMATGIYGWVFDIINPSIFLPGYCWIGTSPPGCLHIDNVPCTRGEEYIRAEIYGGLIIVPLVWFIIIIFMGLIVRKVYKTERQMRRYACGGQHCSTTLKQTKEAGIQALLYVLTFFLCFGPITILIIIDNPNFAEISRPLFFAFALLTKLFGPLQGFFNAIIYLRPRYTALTEPGASLAFLGKIVNVLHRYCCCTCTCCGACCGIFTKSKRNTLQEQQQHHGPEHRTEPISQPDEPAMQQ